MNTHTCDCRVPTERTDKTGLWETRECPGCGATYCLEYSAFNPRSIVHVYSLTRKDHPHE